ncbi:MAG: membrane dipeptidase [Deltaproteobacteria bacterium]|nr:membrane dipeptidase [Deltaproteobacteria bacterium]
MGTKKLCLVLFAGFVFCCHSCTSNETKEKAAKIHADVLTVDTHADTPFLLEYVTDYDLSQDHDPETASAQVDFPRMKAGGLDAIFFIVWTYQAERTPDGNASAKEHALKILSDIHQRLDKAPELAELAQSPEDAVRLETEGRRAVYIGMENGYPIGNDLALIQDYYDWGVRYITLSHSANNDICDSSTDPEGPEHNGLSDFGAQVVAEMNRLGIMVDVSHTSDDTVIDVLAVSTAPVIASHSSARAVYDHPRNLPDNLLIKIAEAGGVIQATFYNGFVKAADPKHPDRLATVADFVDHVDHIVDVAGIDHVGIGSDFDGGAGLKDCRDVSEIGNITLELVRRGYSEEQIRKIWGANLMRVFRQVQAAAANDE